MSRANRLDYPLGPVAKLVICFDYDKGDPGCHTQRNGDPGWPEEPESVEITDVQVWHQIDGKWANTGVSLPEEVCPPDWCEKKVWQHIEAEREEQMP